MKNIDWDSRLFVAARSFDEFEGFKERIISVGNKNVKEVMYWPILSRREGYWISPFSSHKALRQMFGELEGKMIPVMLDLELPTTRNPWLFLTECLWFFSNKRRITRFVHSYKGELDLCEYYPEGKWKENVMRSLGIHYVSSKAKVIKMLYHSLHPFQEEFVRCELERGMKEWENRFVIGLGTIAKGVHGTEPILSLEQLDTDLRLAQEAGIQEVVLFRLAGLNPRIAQLCRKYST